jgi:mRNA-degrading endonuclease RelE of RelBE toxin-antitoxin system
MISRGRIRIKLRVPNEIVVLIRGCHPRLKRKMREGLRHILMELESGKFLKDELTGLQSYRISKFRVIYQRSSLRVIDIVAIGPRKTIYEETYRIVKKESDIPKQAIKGTVY